MQGKDEMAMGQVKKNYKVNNSQCRKCLYRCSDTGSASAVFCGYCYFTGKRRPSPPSPNCTAFVKYRGKERSKLERQLHLIWGFEKWQKTKNSTG
jgi:hypothetical protein